MQLLIATKSSYNHDRHALMQPLLPQMWKTSLPCGIIPIYWVGKLRHQSAFSQASQLTPQGCLQHSQGGLPTGKFERQDQQGAELMLFEMGCEPSDFKAQETPIQWGLKERFPMGRLCCISLSWSSMPACTSSTVLWVCTLSQNALLAHSVLHSCFPMRLQTRTSNFPLYLDKSRTKFPPNGKIKYPL